jgi:hypothetical protein
MHTFCENLPNKRSTLPIALPINNGALTVISINMPNPYGEKLHHRKYSSNGTVSSTNSMSTPNSRLRDFNRIAHAIHRNTTNIVLRRNIRLSFKKKYVILQLLQPTMY